MHVTVCMQTCSESTPQGLFIVYSVQHLDPFDSGQLVESYKYLSQLIVFY